ncbi:Gene 25-like lysozyme, partial [Dysosmobacter welbionis]
HLVAVLVPVLQQLQDQQGHAAADQTLIGLHRLPPYIDILYILTAPLYIDFLYKSSKKTARTRWSGRQFVIPQSHSWRGSGACRCHSPAGAPHSRRTAAGAPRPERAGAWDGLPAQRQ